jgi:hypothetical protein
VEQLPVEVLHVRLELRPHPFLFGHRVEIVEGQNGCGVRLENSLLLLAFIKKIRLDKKNF